MAINPTKKQNITKCNLRKVPTVKTHLLNLKLLRRNITIYKENAQKMFLIFLSFVIKQ